MTGPDGPAVNPGARHVHLLCVKILEGQVLTIDERYSYVPRRIGASNHVKSGSMPAGDYRLRMTFDDGIGAQQHVEEMTLTLR